MRYCRGWIARTPSRQETEAVPCELTVNPPAHRLLERHYGNADVEDALDLPIRS